MKRRIAIALALGLAGAQGYAYDCSGLPTYADGTSYNTGDPVQHNNTAYQCAVGGWCTIGGPYEPGVGWAWTYAWTELGGCNNEQDTPPQGKITNPASGAAFNENDSVIIQVQAADNSAVVSVEFFVNGISIGTDTTAPWQATWTAEAGSPVLSARITDDAGQETVTDTIPISVIPPEGPQAPQISLDAPTDGTTLNPGVISLSATASDMDGSVISVEFFVDGTSVAVDTTAPYQFNWTATQGSHTIHAVATDNDNLSATSDSAYIFVGELETSGYPCRPDGLYTTPGTSPNYCDIYDAAGREKMGADHQRRIIGYFTSWRNGTKGQPSYLVKDIPWDKITHINYAFAHVDSSYSISVGNTSDPDNPHTGMEWPGVTGAETDPTYQYKGHFNQLAKYKKQHPNVKTLISVGGWAETGGHLNEQGERVNDGGFYTMTTNADGSINHTGIETFANSVVDFIRTYGFDGVDIDYEYPTSMSDAGNPLDFDIANPLRAYLMDSYVELMRVLREKLDRAGEEDNTHYLLTIAAPSSGYLLRGMETMPITQYLDYVNIMTYDFHGTWNEYVGHNSALFDNGNDPELKAANIYSTAQYGGIGYLNIDWAVKYFRGSMSPGRINIGTPYYTRGWQNVTSTSGEWGLGGTASLPDQSECPAGTGSAAKCGYGAIGIDNIWHDSDEYGQEVGAGTNPLWHAKNLEQGILGSYIGYYGLDTVNDPTDQLVGIYTRHYDSVSQASWLWNDTKKVFLSTEDEASMEAKAQYVIDQGLGGIMIWELAGDYDWDASKGEYFMGDTMTSLAYEKFKTATPYREKRSDRPLPTEAVDITITVGDFKLGDQNYPLTPKLDITNNTGSTIPGGTVFEFDMPTSTPDTINDQSGAGLEVIESGANSGGGNVGGLQHEFHRLRFSLPSWKTLADGESWELTLNYYLPITGPQAYTATIDGTTYALAFEYPDLPLADLNSGNNGDNEDDGDNSGNDSTNCADMGIDPSGYPTYPSWPAGDHANGGDRIVHNGALWQAKWWTNSQPGSSDGSWELICAVN